MDLLAALPLLLPKAIAWAIDEEARTAISGRVLSATEVGIAEKVGVTRPDLIRVQLCSQLPLPEDASLRTAAEQTGLLGPGMVGLTLGYAVFICSGHETRRLLAHEFRHVFQYEQRGGIAGFLPIYLEQIASFGYANSPLEIDARAHEHLAG